MTKKWRNSSIGFFRDTKGVDQLTSSDEVINRLNHLEALVEYLAKELESVITSEGREVKEVWELELSDEELELPDEDSEWVQNIKVEPEVEELFLSWPVTDLTRREYPSNIIRGVKWGKKE